MFCTSYQFFRKKSICTEVFWKYKKRACLVLLWLSSVFKLNSWILLQRRKFAISRGHRLFDSQLIYSVSTVNWLPLRQYAQRKFQTISATLKGNKQWRQQHTTKLFLRRPFPHNMLCCEIFRLLARRARADWYSNIVIRSYRILLSHSFVMDICKFVRLDTGLLVIFEYCLEVLWHWRFFESYFWIVWNWYIIIHCSKS